MVVGRAEWRPEAKGVRESGSGGGVVRERWHGRMSGGGEIAAPVGIGAQDGLDGGEIAGLGQELQSDGRLSLPLGCVGSGTRS